MRRRRRLVAREPHAGPIGGDEAHAHGHGGLVRPAPRRGGSSGRRGSSGRGSRRGRRTPRRPAPVRRGASPSPVTPAPLRSPRPAAAAPASRLRPRSSRCPHEMHAIGCGHESERRRTGGRPAGRPPARARRPPRSSSGSSSTAAWPGCTSRPARGGLGLTPAGPAAGAVTPARGRRPGGRACATPSATACARPTIVTHGTPEQKARYLRPLFTNEEIWCQLFSEPGAGSDVAGLSTRAERDGEEWLLNGQKVWTTLAHISSFGLIVARTNPDVPKHKGMTAFLVDMKAPGRRGAAALPDHRRGRVQRGLLHRRRACPTRPASAARATGGASR